MSKWTISKNNGPHYFEIHTLARQNIREQQTHPRQSRHCANFYACTLHKKHVTCRFEHHSCRHVVDTVSNYDDKIKVSTSKNCPKRLNLYIILHLVATQSIILPKSSPKTPLLRQSRFKTQFTVEIQHI